MHWTSRALDGGMADPVLTSNFGPDTAHKLFEIMTGTQNELTQSAFGTTPINLVDLGLPRGRDFATMKAALLPAEQDDYDIHDHRVKTNIWRHFFLTVAQMQTELHLQVVHI
ncbi:hypothetical protein OAO87_00710 [bacterium]|nr:hypothetical protein [bacterium]